MIDFTHFKELSSALIYFLTVKDLPFAGSLFSGLGKGHRSVPISWQCRVHWRLSDLGFSLCRNAGEQAMEVSGNSFFPPRSGEMIKKKNCDLLKFAFNWQQVDIYGFCVVVHMMLHGSYMEIQKKSSSDGYIYQPRTSLKRYFAFLHNSFYLQCGTVYFINKKNPLMVVCSAQFWLQILESWSMEKSVHKASEYR